jgi:heme/copper-type cytochrome/quinol oxidase subunit 2
MKKYITLLISFFLPAISFAATCSGQTSINLTKSSGSMFSDVICYVIYIISLLTPILFALAFIFFFWGLSKYVISAEQKELKQGREYMMWGILAIFVLMSYMAIISIVSNELDFGKTPNPTGVLLPQ